MDNKKEDSMCQKDSKNNHRWEYLGIVPYNNKIYKIFECSQCKEAMWNKVNFAYLE